MTRFGRVCRAKIRITNENFSAYVDEIEVNNLRISFNIIKNISWSTNTCSLQIYNLGAEKRNRLKNFGNEVVVEAGYERDEGVKLLFIGQTTKVAHIFDSPEIITSIEAGDGERSLNQQVISVSYTERVQAREVLRQVAARMGVNIAFFADSEDKIYLNGFSDTNYAKNILDKVTNYLGLKWSIQNENLFILEDDGGTTPKAPVIISEENGMIGTPERYVHSRFDAWINAPRAGYKVRTNLMPDVLPGDRLRVISRRSNIDGLFYVDKVNHVGDTHEGVWQSTFEVIEVKQ